MITITTMTKKMRTADYVKAMRLMGDPYPTIKPSLVHDKWLHIIIPTNHIEMLRRNGIKLEEVDGYVDYR